MDRGNRRLSDAPQSQGKIIRGSNAPYRRLEQKNAPSQVGRKPALDAAAAIFSCTIL
jgi:hypothetical protein